MFSKVAVVLSAFVLAAAAQGNQCNPNSLYCCQSVAAADSPRASAIFRELDIDASNVTGIVGLTCGRLTPQLGLQSGACTALPMCCTGEDYGIVVVGCSPVGDDV